MSESERDHIDAMAECITDEFLFRQSMSFIECAINLMATIRHPEEVAAILRDEADLLEQFG
jgi:hypothetical protein